jgi:hypothetical protein
MHHQKCGVASSVLCAVCCSDIYGCYAAHCFIQPGELLELLCYAPRVGLFTVTSIDHLFEYWKHTLVSRRMSFGVVPLFCDCKIGFDVDSAILKWVNLQNSAAETQAIISII